MVLELILGLVLLAALLLTLCITFGGPRHGVPLPVIQAPFARADYTGLAPLQYYKGRDGTPLAFRAYPPGQPAAPLTAGSVVLVHGSSATSRSMHALGQAFARAGGCAYALDLRGHGASGRKGELDHVGQLEEDLQDFLQQVKPAVPVTLVGFSAGAGFALRVAAGPLQAAFAHYLLIAPFLHPRAPNTRPASGGWTSVGVPRLLALEFLQTLGLRPGRRLPVLRFALDAQGQAALTPTYCHALAQNFGLPRAYQAAIRAVRQPCHVLAGADDELLLSEKLAPLFRRLGQSWPVTVLPGLGHSAMVLAPAATAAAVAAVAALGAAGQARAS